MMPKVFRSREVKNKNRHKGISMAECIILVLVVAITMGAILQTIAWSVGLQTFSREDIGVHIFANNWFEALESLHPDVIKSGSDNLEDSSVTGGKIVDQVIARMGRAAPYKYRAKRTGPVDGVIHYQS
ncbi:MAG: hypothetical protein LBP21_02840 [Synergistaceae bacterium]|jgi:hypothetical protein|nr:hypothetical protein [Synergistaceae bacterium]